MAKTPVKQPVKRTPVVKPSGGNGVSKAPDPLNQAASLKRGRFSSKTANGYDLMEVVSTLQKEIRRCNERAAMFWAFEMQESCGENNPCGFAKYLWKRLMIIASEDIGLVNPTAAVLVQSLYQSYVIQTDNFKKAGQSIVIMAHAVLTLARSPKNREVDDCLMWMMRERSKGNYLPIPDYALDNHTFRGKKKGRKDLGFFFEESGRIENIRGSNSYSHLHGDVVNTQHYDAAGPLSCTAEEWDPVHVPEKVGGPNAREAKMIEDHLERVKEKGTSGA